MLKINTMTKVCHHHTESCSLNPKRSVHHVKVMNPSQMFIQNDDWVITIVREMCNPVTTWHMIHLILEKSNMFNINYIEKCL